MAAIKVPVRANGRQGVFVWLDADDVERLGKRRLSLGSHGYAQMRDEGRTVLVHRWVIGARHGDGQIVDHINGNQMDCRKVNLRIVTASESSSNVRARSASGYRGVTACRDKWHARVKLNGVRHHLGTFDTPEEAAQVAHEWRLANLPGYVGRDIAVAPRGARRAPG